MWDPKWNRPPFREEKGSGNAKRCVTFFIFLNLTRRYFIFDVQVHVPAVSQAEQEIAEMVAPQMFLDEESAAKQRADYENEEKRRLMAIGGTGNANESGKAKGDSKGKTTSKGKAAATNGQGPAKSKSAASGGNYSKAAAEEPDPDDDPDDRTPANSGGCCIVM